MRKICYFSLLVITLLTVVAIVLMSVSISSRAIGAGIASELDVVSANASSSVVSKVRSAVALSQAIGAYAGVGWSGRGDYGNGDMHFPEAIRNLLLAAQDIDPALVHLEVIGADDERKFSVNNGVASNLESLSRPPDWKYEMLATQGEVARIDDRTQIIQLAVALQSYTPAKPVGYLYAEIDLNDWLALRSSDTKISHLESKNIKLAITLRENCGFNAEGAEVAGWHLLPNALHQVKHASQLAYPFVGSQVCIVATVDASRPRQAMLATASVILGIVIALWAFIAWWDWRFRVRHVLPIERMREVLRASLEMGRPGSAQKYGSDAFWLAGLLDQLVKELSEAKEGTLWKLEATHSELHRTRARLEKIASDSGVVMVSWGGAANEVMHYTSSMFEFLQFMGLKNDVHHLEWKRLYRLVSKDQRAALRDALRFLRVDHATRVSLTFSGLGGVRVYELRFNCHKTEVPGVKRVDLIAINSTEKKDVERALSGSEERKSAIINVSPEAILVVTSDGEILEANYAAERLLGFDKILLTGLNAREAIFDAEDWGILERQLSANVALGESGYLTSPFAIFCKTESGERIPVEAWVGIVATSGSPKYLCIYLQDLRKRLARDLALVRKSRQLEAVFSMSPAGIAVFDESDKLAAYNMPLEIWLEDAGVPVSKGISREDFWRQLNAVMKDDGRRLSGRGLVEGERVFSFATGSKLTLKCNDKSLTDDKGGNYSTVLFFTDVTQEYQLDELKSSFLATAAHELRTPLAVILGFSELLSDENYSDEEKRQLAGSIFEHSLRLGGLLEDLLDLAKIDANGANAFNFKPAVLSEVVSKFLANSTEHKNGVLRYLTHPVSFHVDEKASNREILCDEAKITRILANFLGNAAKYSKPDSLIDIRLGYEPGHVSGKPILLNIVDHGIGMTAKELEHAFERFWRADSQSGSIPGTGLGLSICKEIIDRHGGQIALDSTPGVGTSVKVYFSEHVSDQAVRLLH